MLRGSRLPLCGAQALSPAWMSLTDLVRMPICSQRVEFTNRSNMRPIDASQSSLLRWPWQGRVFSCLFGYASGLAVHEIEADFIFPFQIDSH